MFYGYRSRYTELVGPLIVHAQQKLVERISENGGIPPPQPHFSRALEANNGLPITPADYAQLQLWVVFESSTTEQEQEQRERASNVVPQGNLPYPRMSCYTGYCSFISLVSDILHVKIWWLDQAMYAHIKIEETRQCFSCKLFISLFMSLTTFFLFASKLWSGRNNLWTRTLTF